MIIRQGGGGWGKGGRPRDALLRNIDGLPQVQPPVSLRTRLDRTRGKYQIDLTDCDPGNKVCLQLIRYYKLIRFTFMEIQILIGNVSF